MPTSPQNPAGIRIEPPPSLPLARLTRPPATAVALPPDEPPADLDGSPRVAGHTVKATDADIQAPELARRGLADEHGAGPAQAGHVGAVVIRHPALEDERSVRRRPALDPVQLLDPHGQPAEGQRGVRPPGRIHSPVTVNMGKGVEPAGPDRRQGRLQLLNRAALPGPKGVHERARVTAPRGTSAHW